MDLMVNQTTHLLKMYTLLHSKRDSTNKKTYPIQSITFNLIGLRNILVKLQLISHLVDQQRMGTNEYLYQISYSNFICINSKNITNMYQDEEQEQVKDPDADLPPFKIKHNDMKIPNVKLIVRKTTQFIKEARKKPEELLEKDICLRLVQYLRGNKADFGAGQGEWQCIIGKNLAATLNYDLHQLTFIDLTEYGYSVLVFKSG